MARFQVGNPGGPGRPPKVVEDAQHSILLEVFDEAAERAVVLAMIRVAKKGEVSAATWLWDRKYGKVKERHEHSGPDGGPLQVETYDYSAAVAEITAGSGADSDASG